MHKDLIEVDSSFLEEVIDRFSDSGDSSHFQIIETMLFRLRAARTRDERLLPHMSLGNNAIIGQMEAVLQKVGYFSAL